MPVNTPAELRAFAQAAGQEAEALHTLIAAAERYPDLAAALARIGPGTVGVTRGLLDVPSLRVAALDCDTEREGFEVAALVIDRLGERSNPCMCGHRGTQHAHQMTGDLRVPCNVDACPCDDVTAPS